MQPDEALEVLAQAIEASPHNLMSPRGLRELRSRHLPECGALADMLPTGPADLADVGSGGGLPGLVIAAKRPDLTVTLIEATRKKAEFLKETAAAMGCEVVVERARVEESHARFGGTFDLVTARAVAPLGRLVEWTVPLLRPGGRLYAVKGQRWQEELEAARAALAHRGARVLATPEEDADTPTWWPRVVVIGV